MNRLELIEVYKSDLQRYSMEQLRHVPQHGGWSLGQMYHHLIAAALDYLDQVELCISASEEQVGGKTEAGEQLYAAGAFPQVKIKLPEGYGDAPSNSESKDDLRRGLDLVLKRMSECEKSVHAASPNCKVQHGGFGWLNSREWFDLIGMHFRHHLRQKSELEQHLEACMEMDHPKRGGV
ncbi:MULTISPECIES: DinB family protein [Paenibacillus]|uniref:DinB family protein n=1 Tax=Paenibacillus TaxID=44249 RepID=UPI0022B8BD5B|nr:DinB family protein [Paenibacillus caseinilyticus]MCZ8519595.1 DinB family protein [Paenibacillus caseinilyticus]